VTAIFCPFDMGGVDPVPGPARVADRGGGRCLMGIGSREIQAMVRRSAISGKREVGMSRRAGSSPRTPPTHTSIKDRRKQDDVRPAVIGDRRPLDMRTVDPIARGTRMPLSVVSDGCWAAAGIAKSANRASAAAPRPTRAERNVRVAESGRCL
jgi:hypothetical protein